MGTSNAVDSLVAKMVRPGRSGLKIKDPNLMSTPSYQLQTESRADEAKTSSYNEGFPLYPFVLAPMHHPHLLPIPNSDFLLPIFQWILTRSKVDIDDPQISFSPSRSPFTCFVHQKIQRIY
ncbi:hypothetical protein U1Q18_046243 [Sarracenia purpurea var. burkii]